MANTASSNLSHLRSLLFLLSCLVPTFRPSALVADAENLTPGGIFDGSPSAAHDGEEFDGGFPSLDSMLHWAIANSDTEELKQRAEDSGRLSKKDLERRQIELKELVEDMKIPSGNELMRIAIADLNKISASFEERSHALNELMVLVELIDNANDLNKLGGLTALVEELYSPNSELRTLAAWVIGVACQNNPLVQKQVLDLGALPDLMNMVNSIYEEEAVKALYAVSAIVRNNLDSQELFYEKSGIMMLQEIMGNSSISIRLRRKSAALVASLAESHHHYSDGGGFSPLTSRVFLKSVVDLVRSGDFELQEKALVALKSLAQLPTTDAFVLKEFCNMDEALESMTKRLNHLMADDDIEFVENMINLKDEVKSITEGKLQ